MINFAQIKFVKSWFILPLLLASAFSFAEPPNLGQLAETLVVYHDSGEYQKELDFTIDKAHRFITERAKQNQQRTKPEKLAIVLDIDETSLSNYENMLYRHFGATPTELRKQTADAKAKTIPAMLALYQDALKQKVAVFFVTGRKEAEKEATVRNLETAGYHNWTGLYLKPDDYKAPSASIFKSAIRASIQKQGYTVIATIGDQISDLEGGYAENVFKLPNPYYYIP